MKKDYLYIFVHVPKTGGTTFVHHLQKNYKKDEVLVISYKDIGFNPNISPVCDYHQKTAEFISKIPPEKRNKIKFISGHFIPFGIHRLFNKKPRYITFLRDPGEITFSKYNYFRTLYDSENDQGKKKVLYKQILLIKGKVPSYPEWLKNKYPVKDHAAVFAHSRELLKSLGYSADLKEFYFVSVRERLKEDLLYLYHLMGVVKFYDNQNISRNYISDGEKKPAKKYFAGLDDEVKLFKTARSINSRFKKDHPEYAKIVRLMKAKRGGYFRKAFWGVSWVGALRLAIRLLGLARMAILARILLPAQFGVYAIAVLILALLESLTETGINVFLVQEEKDIDSYVSTAWIVSILRGLIISLLIVILTPLAVSFFHSENARNILLLTGLIPLIRGFINPAVAKFQKELEFNKEFRYKFPVYLVDCLVAIILSVITKNPVSLIWGLIAGAAFEVFLSFSLVKPVPGFVFEKEKVKKVIGRGKWVTAYGIFDYLFQNLDDLTVGRFLSQSSLGIYQVAYKIASLPTTEIAQVFGRVTFPVYRKIADDRQRLKRAFIKTTLGISALAIPFGIFIFVFTKPLVLILLGENWIEVAGVLRILVIYGTLRAIFYPMMAVFLAVKKQEYVTAATLAGIVGLALSVVPLVLKYGLIGAGMSAVVGSLTAVPVIAYYLNKVFQKR